MRNTFGSNEQVRLLLSVEEIFPVSLLATENRSKKYPKKILEKYIASQET